MPPRFVQPNQEPRLVPSLLLLSDQTNHGQPYAAIDMAARLRARVFQSRRELHRKRESQHRVSNCETLRIRLH